MVITHKLRPMDLTCKNVTQRVDVMQDDKFSRCLALPIRANGADVELPEDVRAIIRYKKPDGTGGNYDTLPDGTSAYTISGSAITVALAPQVCTVPGMVQMAVCLMRGNAEINTFVILVNVHANPGIDVESQDYTNMRGYIKSYGWPPDKTLRTDADGNVVADDEPGGEVDPEVVQQIVEDYLAANPPTVTETDPTVPAWAKAENKPEYTAEEVGALPAENPIDKLVLTSPDGTVWNITVSNDGVITATRATEDGGEETVTIIIPVVRIAGDLTGITADDYVNVTCNFVDEANGVEFTDYAEIAWQGSGSLAFTNVEGGVDKAKNYKIKLYTDETRETKSKRVFKDWYATNNFHIKANFPDCTNFMNNMMMHYLTKSYEYLTPLPRDGARYTVDGFPVLLYINGVFCGVRFWNLKQDDKVYNLNEEVVDETTGAVTQEADLCYQIGLNNGTNSGDNSGAFVYGNLNDGSNAGKNFADAHAEIDYYWEDRVWDKTSNHPDILYNTIQWVSEATNEEFKANLEQYFDKEYLINYFVMMYACGMIDSKGKNFNMLYFPEKGVWYATFWDMDNAFGTYYYCGTTSYNVELSSYGCPSSRLFDKLWANFADEIKAKYWELRETVLTVEQVEDSVNAVWGNVSADWITANEDAKYGGTSYKFKADGASYVATWAEQRFAYMDSVMVTESPEIAPYSEGYINDDGVLVSLANNYVSNDYIEAQGEVKVTSPVTVYTIRIAEYDTDKNFIQRSYVSASTDAQFALSADTRYIRVGFAGSNLDLATLFSGYSVTAVTSTPVVVASGTIDSTTGEVVESAERLYSVTDIPIESETMQVGNNSNAGFAFRFFNSDGSCLGTSSGSVNAGGTATISCPSGTAFVKLVVIASDPATVAGGTFTINGVEYKFVTE